MEVAKKLNKDPAILLISWAVQRGSSVLPKSVTASRIESNFQGELIDPIVHFWLQVKRISVLMIALTRFCDS